MLKDRWTECIKQKGDYPEILEAPNLDKKGIQKATLEFLLLHRNQGTFRSNFLNSLFSYLPLLMLFMQAFLPETLLSKLLKISSLSLTLLSI